MNNITIEFIIAMGLFFIYGSMCAFIGKPQSIGKHKRFVNSIPQILSTLGVIGTFVGITVGLQAFDVNNINASIPVLLDGLKTAFYTSLVGMGLSLLLRWFVDAMSDKADNGLSDMQTAQVEICKSIQQMSEAVISAVNTSKSATEKLSETVTTEIKKIAATQSEFSTQMISAVQNIQNDAHGISELDGVSEILKTLQTNSNNLILSAQGQNATLRSIMETHALVLQNVVNVTENTKEANARIGEILDVSNASSTMIDEGVKQIKSLKDALHGEVVEIEEAMGNTNKLLVEKFDEFSILLQKSNTEALVDVMRNATDEFSRHMNGLIEKLVQENFEQLNQSVERLNTWQQENKEMIQSLISQYRQMAQDFDGTSITLSQVSEDTQRLISRGGTLSRLVETLKSVMIDDAKFSQITHNLTDAVSITKHNIQSFNDTTTRLNEWVRKQRDFNEGVRILIAKLDELNKIRDYGEEFWGDTKRHMEEGIGILKQGSKSLNEQIIGIDERFYARLSTTLNELDSCISAMVEHYNN